MRSFCVVMIAVSVLVGAHARAQSADDLQPRVQTSAALTPPEASPGSVPAKTAAVHASTAAAPPAPAAASESPATTTISRAAAGAANSADRIELGSSEISGNRELPKLLYIVPWQHTQIGQVGGRPPNSLVDEALTPVDRSVFERQNRYYAALQAAASPAAGSATDVKAPAAPTPGAKVSPGAAAAAKDEK